MSMEQARIQYSEASNRLIRMIQNNPQQKKELIVDFFMQMDPTIGKLILTSFFPIRASISVLTNIIIFTLWKEFKIMVASIVPTSNPAVYIGLGLQCRLAFYKVHARRALQGVDYSVDDLKTLDTFEGWVYKQVASTSLSQAATTLQELVSTPH